MSCVARSIKDLNAYQTHLNDLEPTTFVLSQSVYAATCVQIYLELLKGHGITSYQERFCECTSHGSNRKVLYMDDIVVIRYGEAAISHFADFGEQLLKEVGRKQSEMESEYLQGIKTRFSEVERRFQDALARLKPGEVLVSYEYLTRGHRLDFGAVSSTCATAPGDCSSVARME